VNGESEQRAYLSQSAQRSQRKDMFLIAAEGPAIKKNSRSAKKGYWPQAFRKGFMDAGL